MSIARKKVSAVGSSGKWRFANRRMPSQVPSSEVETSNTRTDSVGRSASARARAMRATTPVPLSLAPGTTDREPMSAMPAANSADRIAPAFASPRLPVAAPRAASAGPATAGHISGGLVLATSKNLGYTRRIASGTPGWNTRPECAASWWATRTTVRRASAGPIAATTLVAVASGSTERSRRRRGGVSSAAAQAADAPSAAAARLRPRMPRRPARTPAAEVSPSGHQNV